MLCDEKTWFEGTWRWNKNIWTTSQFPPLYTHTMWLFVICHVTCECPVNVETVHRSFAKYMPFFQNHVKNHFMQQYLGIFFQNWGVTSLRCRRRRAGSGFLRRKQPNKPSLCWCLAPFLISPTKQEVLSSNHDFCSHIGENTWSWPKNARKKLISLHFCGREKLCLCIIPCNWSN